MKSKMLRQRQLKKQVLLRKLQAVRQTGGEDIVASYEPEGEQLDENPLGKCISNWRCIRVLPVVWIKHLKLKICKSIKTENPSEKWYE